MTPQPGRKYTVTHSRKGTFAMHVESVDAEWVSGVIVGGEARGISQIREVGDAITVRISLCKFVPLNTTPESEVKA